MSANQVSTKTLEAAREFILGKTRYATEYAANIYAPDFAEFAEKIASERVAEQQQQVATLSEKVEELHTAAKEFLWAMNNGPWHEHEAEIEERTGNPCRMCPVLDEMGDVLFPPEAALAESRQQENK